MSKLTKLLFSIGLFFSVAVADYSISPVRLVVTPESKVTSLNFRNDNNEIKKFQVLVYEVIKQDGKEVFKDSKEIKAVPVMFSLNPGKTQTIRVESKNIESLKDRNFKVAIKEISVKKPVHGQSVVHVLPEFRIPVSAAIDSSQAQEKTE